MPLRVLVDATAIPADRGGVGRYVEGLVAGVHDAGVDLAVVCQRRDAARFSTLAPHARVVEAPAAVARRPARLVWEQTGLPALVGDMRATVLHSPHYTLPLRAGVPVCVTLHDATFFTASRLHTAGKAGFFQAASWLAARRATRCIVPSQATRRELARVVHAELDRVDVAPHGVDPAVFRPPTSEEIAAARRALRLDGLDYVAFLGTLEPRKNVPALIRAWVRAVRDRERPPALVLAGGLGWDVRVAAEAARVPSHLRLLQAGYLDLDHLRGFLGGAVVVAYPSLGEGFGLPVLEAMACHAPVLTTQRLALPEVGGNAVAYTEPDTASIAAALGALLDDAALRAAIAAAGLARSARFTWAASAGAHLESYGRAASEGS